MLKKKQQAEYDTGYRYKILGSIVYTLQSDYQNFKEIHIEQGHVYSLYYSLILFCNILILLLSEYVVLRS